jgi:hypothetical protein
MKKTQNDQNGTFQPVCGMCVEPDSTRPMMSQKGQTLKPETPHKKSWWARYVARLKKYEGDVRSCCR